MFCSARSKRALFERSEFARLGQNNYNLLASEVQVGGFLLGHFLCPNKESDTMEE